MADEPEVEDEQALFQFMLDAPTKKMKKRARRARLFEAQNARYATLTLIHDRALGAVIVDQEWVSELEAKAIIATAYNDFV